MKGDTRGDMHGYVMLYSRLIKQAHYHVGDMREDACNGFPNNHMEALTFFHGPLFADILLLLNYDASDYMRRESILLPRENCPCYACRSDYCAEALAVARDGEARGHVRFDLAGKSHIVWRHGRILHVLPDTGESVSAQDYIRYRETASS